MKEVFPRLYVSSEADVPKAREKGFAIAHCCKDGPFSHRSLLQYHTMAAPHNSEYLVARRGDELYLNLIDHGDPKFIADDAVKAAVKFIGENLAKGKKVLVHCNHGQSRSPSIALLYLRSIGEYPESLPQAVKKFKAFYPEYDPNDGMRKYLRSKWSTTP